MKTIFKRFLFFVFFCVSSTLAIAQTYTFTNAGATGREGPTQSQIDSNYSGTNLEDKVTINTRGIQEWTVPASGIYKIETWGAKGGPGKNKNDTIINGGKGAYISGKFSLTSGEVIKILVGQKGVDSGGGGGTFIASGSNSALIIAGGGASPGMNGGTGGNLDAVTSNAPLLGGSNGNGGSSINNYGAGGGGFLTNGQNGAYGTGGFAFLNNGLGGDGTDQHNSDGGFGGGGSGSMGYSGGGGGYSGGSGKSNGDSHGGGSYNSGTDQVNTAGVNAEHGKVVITFLSPPTYTFTNAGASGREGPTQSQIDSNYSGTNLADKVTINTRGIQEWTVPESGTYRIEAWGAKGGTGKYGDSTTNSGLGAYLSGKFELSSGNTLKILVGQSGQNQSNADGGGGGGGGTFVDMGTITPLIIAGGGGGGGGRVDQHGMDASFLLSGTKTSNNSGEPGTSGQGGSGGGETWGSGGGAGFTANGGNGGNPATGGYSFTNGGIGGSTKSEYPAIGGFGGGGGVAYSGGGGGGYSGGAGGINDEPYGGGGGGGSYNSGTDQVNTAGENAGHGKVVITFLAPFYTFTNAGATGREGPTQEQIDSNYSGTNLEDKVTINTRGIQEWTVPESGTYSIEAWGAQGGSTQGDFAGGKGAHVKGNFALTQGDVLQIVVGQKGLDTNHLQYGSAGGGGGSFVAKGTQLSSTIPLLVSGGGGGGRQGAGASDGQPGLITNSGGDTYYQGGTNGEGGQRNTDTRGGFAGGGFYTNGLQNDNNSGKSGFAFQNGGLGGIRQDNGADASADGGFGGGGGGMHNANQGSGGGGGYSGGAGGHDNNLSPLGYAHGGGGGSYNSGTDQVNTAGVNAGHGKVIITLVPSSLSNSNEAPSISQGAGPISKVSLEDALITWSASELNATDSDTSESQLSWAILTDPSNGTAVVDGNGTSPQTFTYQPDPNFNGTDSFSVIVSDGDSSDSITINLTIAPVDDPSVISGDTSVLLNEDAVISGDLNATDVEGLTDGSYFSISTAPNNGSSIIDPTDGNWTYTPVPNLYGSDSFTVTVTDDQGSNTTQIVSLTINPVDDPALISGDTSVVLNEDAVIIGDLNATDIEGLTDGSYFSISTAPTNGSSIIDPTDGNWTYTPAPNFYGSDSFTVTVTDDAGNTSSQLIDFTVNPVDDPSIISGHTSKFLNEDSVVTGDLNATDPDGLNDGSLYTISTPPINGFATIDANDGNWTYLPHPNFSGDDSFMVNVTDDLNNSSIHTIQIKVHPVNDPTIVYGDLNATIYADFTTRGKISAKDIDGLHPTIIFEISNPPSSGFATIDALDGNWTYINDKDSLNDDMFEISVADVNGNKTFTNVNLTAQINPPSISTLQPVLTENEELILEGKINYSFGHQIIEKGFLVSNSSDFKDARDFQVNNDTSSPSSYFIAEILPPEEISHVKAYAVTDHGRFFGQSMRYNPFSSKNIWLRHADILHADWLQSDWFGAFIPYSENWIFHESMGWIYIHEFNPENIWLWMDEKEWIWTTHDVFPYFFSNNSSDWLYLLPAKIKGKTFYNRTTKRLE